MVNRKVLRVFGILAFSAILSGGCATHSKDTKVRLDELGRQNALLNAKVEELSQRLIMLESNVLGKPNITMVPPSENDYPLFPDHNGNPMELKTSNSANMDEMPEVPDLTVVKLKPPAPEEDVMDIDDMGTPIFEKAPTPADLDDINPDTLFGKEPPKSGKAELDPNPDNEVDSKAEAQIIYEEGMAHFQKSRYNEAKAGFEKLLKEFPGSRYSDSAHYWIGESLYAEKKYEEALKEFKSVIRDYPNSGKAPDSLLKLYYCFMETGEKENAKQALSRLVELYPYSGAAKIAREKLKTIK